MLNFWPILRVHTLIGFMLKKKTKNKKKRVYLWNKSMKQPDFVHVDTKFSAAGLSLLLNFQKKGGELGRISIFRGELLGKRL